MAGEGTRSGSPVLRSTLIAPQYRAVTDPDDRLQISHTKRKKISTERARLVHGTLRMANFAVLNSEAYTPGRRVFSWHRRTRSILRWDVPAALKHYIGLRRRRQM